MNIENMFDTFRVPEWSRCLLCLWRKTKDSKNNPEHTACKITYRNHNDITVFTLNTLRLKAGQLNLYSLYKKNNNSFYNTEMTFASITNKKNSTFSKEYKRLYCSSDTTPKRITNFKLSKSSECGPYSYHIDLNDQECI